MITYTHNDREVRQLVLYSLALGALSGSVITAFILTFGG